MCRECIDNYMYTENFGRIAQDTHYIDVAYITKQIMCRATGSFMLNVLHRTSST